MKDEIPKISGWPAETSQVPDPDAPTKKESRWARWLKKKVQQSKEDNSKK